MEAGGASAQGAWHDLKMQVKTLSHSKNFKLKHSEHIVPVALQRLFGGEARSAYCLARVCSTILNTPS